jgi:hypothetical protein
MIFGKMSKHQYVDNYVLSNMVGLFVSNRAWMFAVSHMVSFTRIECAGIVGLHFVELLLFHVGCICLLLMKADKIREERERQPFWTLD